MTDPAGIPALLDAIRHMHGARTTPGADSNPATTARAGAAGKSGRPGRRTDTQVD
jgi:hypothetical protein